jgi:hypothetical protein
MLPFQDMDLTNARDTAPFPSPPMLSGRADGQPRET